MTNRAAAAGGFWFGQEMTARAHQEAGEVANTTFSTYERETMPMVGNAIAGLCLILVGCGTSSNSTDFFTPGGIGGAAGTSSSGGTGQGGMTTATGSERTTSGGAG